MGDQSWVDLAANTAGAQVAREANRRRRADGAGADRSWRVGLEGEHLVAEALHALVTPSRWERLRGRRPSWWVLHSVPVGTGSSDIDHVVCGPAGVFTINTKHHRARRVNVEQDRVVVGGEATEYVSKAVAESNRATRLLRAGVDGELAARVSVRPILAIVGARLLSVGRPGGVIVTTPAMLATLLREMPAQLSETDVGQLFEIARRSTTWTPPAPPAPQVRPARSARQSGSAVDKRVGRVEQVYFLTVHEPYNSPEHPAPVDATIVHARSLLHPSIPQPDGARMYRCLTEAPGRVSGQLVPLSTLTYELDGGALWPQVGDWEQVSHAVARLARERGCDAIPMRLPPISKALLVNGPDTTVTVSDPGGGPSQLLGRADREKCVAALTHSIERAAAERPFWPGDDLVDVPTEPTVMPYRPFR